MSSVDEQLLARADARIEADARRKKAALALAPSQVVFAALLRGRSVPRQALAPEFRDRIVSWDGVLDAGIVLDVLVLLEADRAAGDIQTPEPSYGRRRAA